MKLLYMSNYEKKSLPQIEEHANSVLYTGFVGILGQPNVGKSTLMNQILGEKLSISSPKPQTTRQRLLGVLTKEPYQIAIFDTPGIHQPHGPGKSLLNRFMVEEAIHVLQEVDIVVFVTNAQVLFEQQKKQSSTTGAQSFKLNDEDLYLLSKLPQKKPVILAMNKIDLISDKRFLLPLLETWQAAYPFHSLIPLSAKTGEGVTNLLTEICSLLPKGSALFEQEMLTDRTEKYLAAERIREQVFHLTYQEIPYSVAVTIDSWEESIVFDSLKKEKIRNGVRIHATIHVEKSAQKLILVGRQGSMIRDIGTKARKEIAEFLGCSVQLFLFVRVDENWSGRTSSLREMGYE